MKALYLEKGIISFGFLLTPSRKSVFKVSLFKTFAQKAAVFTHF
ncbi:hypothetical protein [Paenibacillus sp. PK3_47]|nr:hypothetical protein [Paenibacillus sp. PK3_47]